ncbi:hypothetical protein HY256_05415, partial [Candidatus Sumerlaeota bacterium]|nr:hypothetical protein [Candidatus Sumerlaeota bacterium]
MTAARGSLGADFWSDLNTTDTLREARAAYHLGILDGGSLPALSPKSENATTSPAVPTALSLAEKVLAQPAAGAKLQIEAVRIKLLALNRLGNGAASEKLLAGLPSSLPGIDPVEWTLQKKLWGYMRDASGGRWDEIDDELTHFPQKPALRGHAAADLALLKAQCDIRMSQGSLTGFYDLAEAIGGSADWGIADPQFDPYYAYSDFATLNTWDGVGDVLVKLSQDKSSTRIGARRWFELAAPSVLYPFGMLYSDISIEDRNQLRAHYYERAAAFVPDPKVPPPATGGYREILANQLRGEAFIYTGKGQLLLEALKTLPAQVAGIPDSLWNAYKIGWRTLGYGGTLSLGDALDSAQQISEAVELLPDSPFKAHVHA